MLSPESQCLQPLFVFWNVFYKPLYILHENLYFFDEIFVLQSLRPGINLLGRVIHVSDVKIKVSMPCKLLGNVMACHISESYNKLLEAYVEDKVIFIIIFKGEH